MIYVILLFIGYAISLSFLADFLLYKTKLPKYKQELIFWGIGLIPTLAIAMLKNKFW